MRVANRRSITPLRATLPLGYGGGELINAFVSTWNTENTSAGSSDVEHVKLPLVSGGTYAFNVDWGDGTDDDITVWDAAAVDHDYTVATGSGAGPGTYTLTITGQIDGWAFNNTLDRLKIVGISSWGPLLISIGAFYSAPNWVCTATDSPQILGNALINGFYLSYNIANLNLSGTNFSNVTNITNMLRSINVSGTVDVTGVDWSSIINLSALTRDSTTLTIIGLDDVDVSNVENYSESVRRTVVEAAWDQWTITSMTNAAQMFDQKSLATDLYSRILVSWAAQVVAAGSGIDNVVFHGGSSYYSGQEAIDAHADLVAHFWTLTDLGVEP